MKEHLYIGRWTYPSSIFAVDPAAEKQNVTLYAPPRSLGRYRGHIALRYA